MDWATLIHSCNFHGVCIFHMYVISFISLKWKQRLVALYSILISIFSLSFSEQLHGIRLCISSVCIFKKRPLFLHFTKFINLYALYQISSFQVWKNQLSILYLLNETTVDDRFVKYTYLIKCLVSRNTHMHPL